MNPMVKTALAAAFCMSLLTASANAEPLPEFTTGDQFEQANTTAVVVLVVTKFCKTCDQAEQALVDRAAQYQQFTFVKARPSLVGMSAQFTPGIKVFIKGMGFVYTQNHFEPNKVSVDFFLNGRAAYLAKRETLTNDIREAQRIVDEKAAPYQTALDAIGEQLKPELENVEKARSFARRAAAREHPGMIAAADEQLWEANAALALKADPMKQDIAELMRLKKQATGAALDALNTALEALWKHDADELQAGKTENL